MEDPLPGWREGRARAAIVDFVMRVTASGKCFIVTGGGVDFVRAFAEEGYGIAPERVIGSSGRIGFEIADGGPVLRKLAGLGSFNDREAKPANIGLHIGRRPMCSTFASRSLKLSSSGS